ncbi:MAG: nitrogen fixation protein FixH [Pseudomonadota bacterium]
MSKNTASTQSTEKNETPDNAPWWRFPIVWMVFGGPAVVVVASLVTMVVALRNIDPVLDTSKTAATTSQAPALSGRNHSAEPATKPADQ